METIVESLGPYEKFLVTVETAHSLSALPQLRKHFVRRVERNPANLILNGLQAAAILVVERPDVVISTGAGDTVPLLLLASLLGIPSVFVESVARVNRPSLTGRIVKRWIDLIILPWPSLRSGYPRGIPVAPLVRPGKSLRDVPAHPRILILTGTGPRGYNRLLKEIDTLLVAKKLDGHVFAQIGDSSYIPQHFTYERFIPHPKLLDMIRESDLVITHDGVGSIRESAAAGKPIIVVPRDAATGEVAYKSDAELSTHLGGLGWVTVVEEPVRIPHVLASPETRTTQPLDGSLKDASEVLEDLMRSVKAQRINRGRRSRSRESKS